MKGKSLPASWLNKALLPPDISTSEKTGYYAEFYDDGQLKYFAAYREGVRAHWYLDLHSGIEAGRVTNDQGNGASSGYETYKDGCYEVFDDWSDNSRPQPMPYRKWLERWIGTIVATEKEFRLRTAALEENLAYRCPVCEQKQLVELIKTELVLQGGKEVGISLFNCCKCPAFAVSWCEGKGSRPSTAFQIDPGHFSCYRYRLQEAATHSADSCQCYAHTWLPQEKILLPKQRTSFVLVRD